MAEAVKKLKDQVRSLEEKLAVLERHNVVLQFELTKPDEFKQKYKIVLKDNENLRQGTAKLIKGVAEHEKRNVQLEKKNTTK